MAKKKFYSDKKYIADSGLVPAAKGRPYVELNAESSMMPSGKGQPYAHPMESVVRNWPQEEHLDSRVELPSIDTIDRAIASNVKKLRSEMDKN